MNNPKIAFLSAHFSGAIKLDYLLWRGLKIDTIINLSPDDAARHGVMGYVDLETVAATHGLNLYRPTSFGLKDDLPFFTDTGFDILLISGWQRLIPTEILSTLRLGAVGEHGSSAYLPRGRGRSPAIWSIIAGHRRFVLHLFLADAGADSGPVIDYETIAIEDADTIKTVYAKIGLVSGRLFLKNLPSLVTGDWQPKIAAGVTPTELPKRGDKDDFLDWSSCTRDLYNKVRAITRPYPGAKSWLGDSVLTVWSAQPFDLMVDDFAMRDGEVVAMFPDKSFLVKTFDGDLLVTDYATPRPIKVGDRLS